MNRHFFQIGKPALTALLIGIVLLLDAMAVCPALHEMIHHDAGKADHDCAVTMFTQGKASSVTCEIIIPLPPISIGTTRYFNISAFSPAIENLPPGRAPPSVSSPHV